MHRKSLEVAQYYSNETGPDGKPVVGMVSKDKNSNMEEEGGEGGSESMMVGGKGGGQESVTMASLAHTMNAAAAAEQLSQLQRDQLQVSKIWMGPDPTPLFINNV